MNHLRKWLTAGLICLCASGALCAQIAQEAIATDVAASADPAAGPWLERSNEYFRFVYKRADSKLVDDCLAVSEESFRIVTGYLQCLPAFKPTIIIYGAMDSPTMGGFTSALPLRIGIVASQARFFTPKTLLVHEFTHYMTAVTEKSGWLGKLIGPFAPDARRWYTNSFSDLSIEGTTSFIDGYRRSERACLPIRAALLEGQMWNYDQVSTGGLRQPAALRVYLSGMLIQDWLYDSCGDVAFLKILDARNKEFLPLESPAFKEYTGLDIKVAWGDIRTGLEKRYAFARELPLGVSLTPRDSDDEPQWGRLLPTAQGFLQYRSGLYRTDSLGFWRPLEKEKVKGKEKPRGKLEGDPGTFITLKGLVSDDFSADSGGDTVAAILNEPADTAVLHDSNRDRLAIARIQWNADFSQACVRGLRLIPGHGFASPCLSLDGSRLFATLRESDFYRAVEVDQTTGKPRALSLPTDISVTELSISPDGQSLALGFVKEGRYDVGSYDLASDSFSAITDDEAMDFGPRFLSDGSFVFSSDRENTVAVYRYADGAYTREIMDAVAAYYPANDGQGGFYYSSYSAFGHVIRHLDASRLAPAEVPGFVGMRPDWLARRDAIWDGYGKKGVELAAEKQGAAKPSAERPFIDIAKPALWFPDLSLGLEGYGLGVMVMGTSFLGENSYTADLRYLPDSQELAGNLAVNLRLPFISADLSLDQTYSESVDERSVSTSSLSRSCSLGAEIPIGVWRSPDLAETGITASANVSYAEGLSSGRRFSFLDSLSMAPARELSLMPGIEGKISLPAPPTALGGSFLRAKAQGLAEWNGFSSGPGFGAVAELAAGLRVGMNTLTLSGKGAWRGNGAAHALIPRATSRWEGDSVDPYHAEASLSLCLPSLEKESGKMFLMSEQTGTTLGFKGFWEAASLSAPRALPEVELFWGYTEKIIFFYNPLFLDLGLSYRYPIDPLGPADFNSDNLCFRMSFAGISMSF